MKRLRDLEVVKTIIDFNDGYYIVELDNGKRLRSCLVGYFYENTGVKYKRKINYLETGLDYATNEGVNGWVLGLEDNWAVVDDFILEQAEVDRILILCKDI